MISVPQLGALNIMGLHSPESAISSAGTISAPSFCADTSALKGVALQANRCQCSASSKPIYGVGGLIAPFVGIKLIDLLVGLFV